MKISNSIKGDFYGMFYAILSSTVFIFWKYLLEFIPKPILMFYWFGTAFIVFFIYIVFTKHYLLIKRSPLFLSISFVLCSATTIILQMIAIEKLGSALTAFLMQSTIVFVIMYSYFGLKERLSKYEMIGVSLIVFGLIVLNFKGNISLSVSSGIVICAALSQATAHYIGKILLKEIDVIQLNVYRVSGTMLVSLLYILFTGMTFVHVGFNDSFILLLGVFFGPILYIFYYKALKLMSLPRANAIKNISPVFTLFLAYFMFNEVLSIKQIVAVLLIFVGAYIIVVVDRVYR